MLNIRRVHRKKEKEKGKTKQKLNGKEKKGDYKVFKERR